MAASPTGRHEKDTRRVSMVAQGLVFGPGLGLLVALLVSGTGEAISIGLVVGAALGVAVGSVLDAEHEQRTR